MKKLAFAAVLFTLAAGAAPASGPGESHSGGAFYPGNGVLTYAMFEAAVEHADLEGCPAEFDTDAVFCRITLANDMAHVFAFAHDGDQPLLAIKSYELGDGFLPF